MTRKALLTFAVISLLAISFSGVALASDFASIYTVKNDQSTTQYDTFSWDETPWLYLYLPQPGGSLWNSSVTSDWFYESETTPRGEDDGNGFLSRSYWLKLDNWSDITVREDGSWLINATFTSKNLSGWVLNSGSGSTTFTVTPEPISYALFLIGGVALAVRQYRKKKLD